MNQRYPLNTLTLVTFVTFDFKKIGVNYLWKLSSGSFYSGNMNSNNNVSLEFKIVRSRFKMNLNNKFVTKQKFIFPVLLYLC